MPKVNKLTTFLKCHQCRKDRQKCSPEGRSWPGKRCDRCQKYGYSCSASRTKLQEQLEAALTSDPSGRSASQPADQKQKNEVQCLQELGDLRQLLDACSNLIVYSYTLHIPIKEDLKGRFSIAISGIRARAEQYRIEGRYRDAEYMYRKEIFDSGQRNRSVLPGEDGRTIVSVYENMGDLPAAETALEDFLLVLRAENPGDPVLDQNLAQEAKNLATLYFHFYQRVLAMEPSFVWLANLSILCRAATLDLAPLNLLLYEQEFCSKPIRNEITPLHIAAHRGALKMASLLLDKGTDVNATTTNLATPLLTAARYGNARMVDYLLEHGADVKARNVVGDTALHQALRSDTKTDEQVVLNLIKRHVEIDAKGRSAKTALQTAIRFNELSIARILLEHGADTEIPTGHSGETALFHALANGSNAAIDLLLEYGANIEATGGRTGGTALFAAVISCNTAAILMLLDHDADINAKDGKSGYGTPLHAAVEFGHEIAVQILLDRGANKEARDSTGSTPLALAVSEGHQSIAKILLDYGADIAITSKNLKGPACTLLHKAVRFQYVPIVKLLLDAGADIRLPNSLGNTSLHDAIGKRNDNISRLLIGKGAPLQAMNRDRNTPLHLAMGNKDSTIVRLLLAAQSRSDAKLNVAMENAEGHSVYDLAVQDALDDSPELEGWREVKLIIMDIMGEDESVVQGITPELFNPEL